MENDPNEAVVSEVDGLVDLSELKNISFQPAWANAGARPEYRYSREPSDSFSKRPEGRERRSSGNFKPSARGDRENFHKKERGDKSFSKRPFRPKDGSRPSFNGRRNFHNNERRGPEFFKPVVDVEFYPNDAVYEAVVAALRATAKTYELFSAAKLFLEKPERFAMVLKKAEDQKEKSLFLTLDDGFVFLSEEDAVRHVLQNHLQKYFDVDEQDCNPPAGNFICLHKCGMTGKVLCPPNYHKYHELLAEHHQKFLPRVPFEKFKERIEKITDSEEIEKWKVAASKTVVYTPKEVVGDEAKKLVSYADLLHFFSENLKDKVIARHESVRISGEIFSKMPRNLLTKSIFVAIEREKKFPLKFSNNLRGRLRRSGFTMYKVGGKSGISYISGIKRKFRVVGEVFADDVQKIISCIDANPKISVTSLCLQCVQSNDAMAIGSGAITSSEENLPDVSGTGNSQECAADFSTNTLENSPSAVAENSEVNLDKEILRNLHWLIREGYVAEFEDGTLIATEIMPAPKKTLANSEPAAVAVDKLQPSDELLAEENFNEDSQELAVAVVDEVPNADADEMPME